VHCVWISVILPNAHNFLCFIVNLTTVVCICFWKLQKEIYIFVIYSQFTNIYNVEFHNSNFFTGSLNIYLVVNSIENWEYLRINMNAVYKWSSENSVNLFDMILTVHRRYYVKIKCRSLPYKKPTKNTHTRPPRHSTHIITNLDNTRHLVQRTQILPNLQITFYIFTAPNTTDSNHCIIILSSWWWVHCCPKHFEQTIRSEIKTSFASSWHFISTYQ